MADDRAADSKTQDNSTPATIADDCRLGNVKAVRTRLRREQPTPEQLQEALKAAAEYDRTDIFALLLNHCDFPPDEATLLHSAKWSLRYHNRRILGLVMQADTGRWVLPRGYLEELRSMEQRQSRPDQVLLYLLERLFTVEKQPE